MDHRNDLGKLEYVLSHVYWGFLAMLLYRTVLFIPVDGFTASECKKSLWMMVVVLATAGIIFTFHNRRTTGSVFVNVMFPYVLYAFCSYRNYFPAWMWAAFWTSLIISLAFVSILFFGKRKLTRASSSMLWANRVRRAILGVRTITVVCLCAFILPLAVRSFFGKDLYQYKGEEVIDFGNTEEWTIENNIDTVVKLKEETWKKLTLEERMEVLGVIKNIEMNYLGINHDLTLSADPLSETTLGSYYTKERKIVINISHLKNSPAEEVLATLAHECYHAYSWQQIELYKQIPEEYKNMLMFQNAKIYEKEFANYTSGSEDYYAYATQYCEMHADRYGDAAAKDYYERIEKYEKENAA